MIAWLLKNWPKILMFWRIRSKTISAQLWCVPRPEKRENSRKKFEIWSIFATFVHLLCKCCLLTFKPQSFLGLTGDEFKFNEHGDGPARYNIIHYKQVSRGIYEWVNVGLFHDEHIELNMESEYSCRSIGTTSRGVIWIWSHSLLHSDSGGAGDACPT
jgi:hypothetical protein